MRPGEKLYGFHEEPKKVIINGPRPSSLVINKDSHMIRKETKLQRPQRINPIIIYTESPKIIHTKAKDFMALVQRLTGRSSSTNDNLSTASLPQEGFPRSLKGQPHCLLPVSLLTNSLFLHLYRPLLSHPINTNELLPLLPVFVSDLIITATIPFS